MKTLIHYAAGIIFSLCLMVTLLITSVEAVVYWTPGYFEKEYAKYNVTEAVDMTMEDLLDVTDQMMAYLRGKRADLHVDTPPWAAFHGNFSMSGKSPIWRMSADSS